MYNYSIYNMQTGSIDKTLSLAEPIENTPENTEYYVEGIVNGNTHYVDVSAKQVVEIPEKPGANYLFDYYSKSWVPDLVSAKLSVDEQVRTLLKDTDWLVIRYMDTGQPVSASMQSYRQALREIDTQPGYPMQVVWPTLA